MKSIFFEVNLPRIALTKALSLVNRSFFYSGVSALRYADIDEPELPGAEWVKVKTRMCGVCGSDLHLITLSVDRRISLAALPKHMPKKNRALKFLGHEVVGEIVETGGKVEDSIVTGKVCM